jgi:hypothetical protein
MSPRGKIKLKPWAIRFQRLCSFSTKGDTVLSLRFLEEPWPPNDIISFSPKCVSFIDAVVRARWNYVAWNTAFCAYPCLLLKESHSASDPESGTLFEKYLRWKDKKISFLEYYLDISDRSLSGLCPHPWTLTLDTPLIH